MDVNEIHAPNYRELVVKRVYEGLKEIEFLMKYMPDYPEGVFPEKSFFYSVLSTIYPYWTKNLVEEWRKKRSVAHSTDRQEMVEIIPDILEEINKLLLYPSNYDLILLFLWSLARIK